MQKQYTSYKKFFYLVLTAFILSFYSCGNDELPIKSIQKELNNVPHYSVILNDMKEEGNFFKEYLHQYKVVQPNLSWKKDWVKVPKQYYQSTAGLLGMALLAKKENEIIDTAFPPAFQYVGDTRYGSWKPDNSGNMLWAFSRGVPLFRELDIDIHPPVYKKDYSAYTKSKTKKVPFLGLNKQYGTSGTFTKKIKPDFFARHKAKQSIKAASFTTKVSSRIGRSKTNFRGRSGSGGK